MRAGLVVALVWLWAASASAQSALAATQIHADQVPPEATLVFRPSGPIRALASKVARVLELRSGRPTLVGEAPPAGMLEGIPAGQVGMAFAGDGNTVRLLLVAADGRTATARVALSAGGGNPDARAVALVVEALQDDLRTPRPQASDTTVLAEAEVHPLELEAPEVSTREPVRFTDADDSELTAPALDPDFLGEITPLVLVRMFTGVSSSSTRPMTGIGAGLGVCAQRNCALVTAEYPVSSASDQLTPDEVRYRYLTFASGFYTRPVDLGPFTPGAGLAFVTRIGSVEGAAALETDLGLRATVEMAWRPLEGVDVLAEAGLDLALDQARSRNGYTVTYRGDQWTPWLQAAVRLRPEMD